MVRKRLPTTPTFVVASQVTPLQRPQVFTGLKGRCSNFTPFSAGSPVLLRGVLLPCSLLFKKRHARAGLRFKGKFRVENPDKGINTGTREEGGVFLREALVPFPRDPSKRGGARLKGKRTF